MDSADWFLLLIRWLHGLAAAAWIGGSIFFLVVLSPILRGAKHGALLSRVASQEFRHLVDTAIWVLLVTGVILAINRLTSAHANNTYGVILGLKMVLAMWMFYLVWFRQKRQIKAIVEESQHSTSPLFQMKKAVFSATNLILILGAGILLLSDVLRDVIEHSVIG